MNPLLGNNRETDETNAIARQQLRKLATLLTSVSSSGPGATNKVLFEEVFSICLLRGVVV
jgi:hypothetical protein